jgi:hypothetical protein
MSQYDKLFSTIETIGTTNPIADDNGALTIAPRHKADPNVQLDPKMIAESKNRKSDYDMFFNEVSMMEGTTTSNVDNIIRTRVKNVLTETVSVMSDGYMKTWTEDKNIIEACNKLRPILEKITKRL